MINNLFRLCISALLAVSLHAQDPEPQLGSWPSKTGTTFRLWAPAAQSVEVIGTFNNWDASSNDAMEREPGGLWSVHIRSAKAGDAYLYLIDGSRKQRDPHGRLVDADSKVTLIYDPKAFDWSGDTPPTYTAEELVIYEMHIGTFNDPNQKDQLPGTFLDAIRRLDYVKHMGFNTVCIMPVHDFIGHHSWGYNPIDVFAIENIYGGPDAFKKFVRACHDRGLAVHVDIVHNHYGPGVIDLEGFKDTTGGRLYFYDDHRAGTPWGPRPDFGSPGVRRFITQNILMWLEEYRVDGFRWDSTVNIREGGGVPIDDGLNLMNDINDVIRERFPHAISIAEDSVDIGNFHGSWEYGFHHRVMPQLSAREDHERDMYAIEGAVTDVPHMHRVIYTDSHDEAGDLNGNFRIARDVDPENPGSMKASRMLAVAGVLTYTAPGIPMMLQGNEFQQDGRFSDQEPLRWNNVKRFEPLVKLHRELAMLRRNASGKSPALLGRKAETLVIDQERQLLAYARWSRQAPADKLVVAVNLSGQSRETEIPIPVSGKWGVLLDTDWNMYGGRTTPSRMTAYRVEKAKGTASVKLAPYSAQILYRQGALPQAHRKPGDFEFLQVSGSFNDFNPENAPMKKRSDTLWLYRKSFYFSKDVSFSLTDGRTSLGGEEILAQKLPLYTQLKPGGNPVHIEGEMSGDYIFAFHTDTFELAVYPYEPPPPGSKSFPSRTWKDQMGQELNGKFIGQKGRNVSIELDNGRVARFPLSDLDRRDQEYIAIITNP